MNNRAVDRLILFRVLVPLLFSLLAQCTVRAQTRIRLATLLPQGTSSTTLWNKWDSNARQAQVGPSA